MSKLGRNDPCHCNSGKKYKKCCLQLDEKRLAGAELALSAQTLRGKNVALLEATAGIFGLDRPWENVKEGFSDAQVREFYTFVAHLWPVDTDLAKLLPTPDSALRALYLGENEPEAMLESVFRFCLYADQIFLLNPFNNPNVIAEKYNPISCPGEWKLQTLRVIFHLALLAPWIYAGLVVLVPDPGDFNRQLRVKTWDLAAERLKGWSPSSEDIDNSAIGRRARKAFLLAPLDYLERKVRESNPGISDSEVERFLVYVTNERKRDPLLLNDSLDSIPGQMMATSFGTNLEMGMYLCHATGAFPYTNVKFRWKEILAAHRELHPTAQVWSPLTNAFQQLTFKFLNNVDSKFACSVRQEGRLEGFRSYLRKLWNSIGGEPDASKSEALARDFRDELTQAFNEAKAEWDSIDRDLLKWGAPTVGSGLVAAGAAIATGSFSLEIPAAGLVVGGVAELVQAALKRREFRRKIPMSVFIDLENRNEPRPLCRRAT